MGVPTHVMEYSGGMVSTKDRGAGPLQFLGPLRQLNGTDRWYIAFHALPPGKDYPDIAGQPTLEYLQAAGSAEAMTVEVRKAGGAHWGADWVRYIVGRPQEGPVSIDVPIVLPSTTEMRSKAEVFDADEAAQLFISYHKTGDIPPGYVLRPIEGYTADGGLIDLRGVTA